PDASANGRPAAAVRIPRAADARSEVALRLVEAARRAGGHGQHERILTVRNAADLILRHALAGTNHPVEAISRTGDQRPVRQYGDRLRRVVARRIEARHVVALRVRGQVVLIADAVLEVERARRAPPVAGEHFGLPEAAESDRGGLRVGVGAEVA